MKYSHFHAYSLAFWIVPTRSVCIVFRLTRGTWLCRCAESLSRLRGHNAQRLDHQPRVVSLRPSSALSATLQRHVLLATPGTCTRSVVSVVSGSVVNTTPGTCTRSVVSVVSVVSGSVVITTPGTCWHYKQDVLGHSRWHATTISSLLDRCWASNVEWQESKTVVRSWWQRRWRYTARRSGRSVRRLVLLLDDSSNVLNYLNKTSQAVFSQRVLRRMPTSERRGSLEGCGWCFRAVQSDLFSDFHVQRRHCYMQLRGQRNWTEPRWRPTLHFDASDGSDQPTSSSTRGAGTTWRTDVSGTRWWHAELISDGVWSVHWRSTVLHGSPDYSKFSTQSEFTCLGSSATDSH